ncbi:MAG: guanylate kinase [Chloroflexi bacterium]|nr:guanylate kinase [Chloroflexota bacterium]
MSDSKKLPGVIFVMIGPGGAGKNAIMKALMAGNPAIRQLATATTRKMRADEAQGREHLFVSKRRFEQMIAAGELLEHQEVTPGKYYGIPRASVAAGLAAGEIRIADIEVIGASILADAFADNVVQIFVTAPGATLTEQLAVLQERMRERDDAFTDIEQRLRRARELELPYQSRCDYVVVNDCLAAAIERTRAIIQRELAGRQLAGAPK